MNNLILKKNNSKKLEELAQQEIEQIFLKQDDLKKFYKIRSEIFDMLMQELKKIKNNEPIDFAKLEKLKIIKDLIKF